jgi:hypothetical protein
MDDLVKALVQEAESRGLITIRKNPGLRERIAHWLRLAGCIGLLLLPFLLG